MRPGLALLALIIASPVSAQRALHWREVHVDATLEADGTLRIKERQTIVFTGDWNGGQRVFNVRPRQRFRFAGMYRLDSIGGIHGMEEGNLDVIDGYDFTGSRTLRWRSRLATDPPFMATPLTYVIEYSLANILVPDGDGFLLDHNVDFADREGMIENLSVQLTLDPAWQPMAAFTGWYQGRVLPPGEGFVVRVPMRYVGSGEGPVTSIGAPVSERVLLAGVLLLLLASIGRRLYARERETGRLEPLPKPDASNRKWLDEEVFRHPAEVIGAAWDNRTGESEVAALLARLCADGRMRSEVKDGGTLKGPVLHLELLADRDRFHGYERKLVDALFARGESRTDTATLREHYKQSGFDPASKISKPLAEVVKSLVPGSAPSQPSSLPSLLAFLGAVALLIAAVVREPADAPVVILGAAVMLVCFFMGVGGAVVWRSRVHDVRGSALFFVIPLAVPLVGLLIVLASGVTLASTLALAGLTLLYFSFANSVFNQARARENRERIAFRRRLAVARQYFVDELQRDTPRLEDTWFPYLIAFGLGKHMDKWFKAFGGESPAVGHSGHSSGSHGGGSHSGGGGWSGFGGGGGFSGGGASASWAAAAGSIASGVSAPSSSSGGSSGGGGGGGGGSSGGGGGGGW